MQWNDHSRIEGRHATFSASKYNWLNYTDDKLVTVYDIGIEQTIFNDDYTLTILFKAFVWAFGGQWLSTYSSSMGPSLYNNKVSVNTFPETQTVHFDIELGDSGGYFYMGSVHIYGWTD